MGDMIHFTETETRLREAHLSTAAQREHGMSGVAPSWADARAHAPPALPRCLLLLANPKWT